MAFEEVKKYPFDFALLGLGLVFLGVIFFHSGYSPLSQKKIIFFASFFYFIWGLGHHLLRGDFHLKILLEYLLVAAFAAVAGVLVLSRL